MSDTQKDWMIGCDWGTSSFRIRLIDRDAATVTGELTSQQGVAATFNEWREQPSLNQSQYRFFARKLQGSIDALSKKVSANLSGLPVVVTGMASSSIGMTELPYAELPFSMTASDVVVKRYEAGVELNHPLWLVSGVRDRQDVMRGEEIQLIGLMNLLPMPASDREMTVILPGTHSKHCLIRADELVSFCTYMTGELYKLMSQHSILKDSVEVTPASEWTASERTAFSDGVARSRQSDLLSPLFTVRTNSLFDVITKKSNSFYLSGLLIGQELGYLVQDRVERPIVICGGSQVHPLYMQAMDVLAIKSRVHIVPDDLVDKATIKGQALLLN